MKAVILAGGRGKRMNELTNEVPKPLLKYDDKPLLQYKLENLPTTISSIIIVVGYLKEKIIDEFGYSFNGLPIQYVEQTTLDGTAGALALLKDYLDEDFIVLMADDIYSKEDILKVSQTKSWSILVKTDLDMEFTSDEVKEILTGKSKEAIYTGLCHLDKGFFDLPMVEIGNCEFGLPQTIAPKSDMIEVISTDNWKRITTPDELK